MFKASSFGSHAIYDEPIEVEIFNEALCAMPGDKVLTLTKERYLGHV